MDLGDLHAVAFAEILDVLDALGHALDFETNPHVSPGVRGWACRHETIPPRCWPQSYVTCRWSLREYVREMADSTVGIDYLDGW